MKPVMQTKTKDKVCKGYCKESLPLENFGSNNRQPDGKNTWCRDCTKKYHENRKSGKPSKQSKEKKSTLEITKKVDKELEVYTEPKPIKKVKELKPEIRVIIEADEDINKTKDKWEIDYTLLVQGHEIKGCFRITTNYKPDKLTSSATSVVNRQLRMIGVDNFQLIKIDKPRKVKA